MANDDAQLIAQLRELFAKANRDDDLASEGGWKADSIWHGRLETNYWQVVALTAPKRPGVLPYETEKALTQNAWVAGLLTLLSTGMPRLLELADAGRAALQSESPAS